MTVSSSTLAAPSPEAPAPATTQACLHLYRDHRLVAAWRFDRSFRIGCDATCPVRLDDPRVDPQHAEVYVDDAGTWRVRDLGGRHRTFVNGAEVDEARLGTPSVLQIGWNGPVLRLTLEPDAEPAPNGLVTNGEPLASLPGPLTPARPAPAAAPAPPTMLDEVARYQGHGFTLPLPEAWRDRTLYTLEGPVADGIRHTVLVEVSAAPADGTLDDYVDAHVALLRADLDGFRLIRRDALATTGGAPARRVIFCWRPHRHRLLFQEQLFIRHADRIYTLTASFTNASRKQVGALVEAVMLGFAPDDATQPTD